MARDPRNKVLWWAGLAFAGLFAAWITLFVIASRNKVAEVPLETTRGGTAP